MSFHLIIYTDSISDTIETLSYTLVILDHFKGTLEGKNDGLRG